MRNFLVIAFAGAMGSLARYGFQYAFNSLGDKFPLGTYLANSLGCFIAGMLAPFWSQWPELVKLALLTGFLGAFTSFSSFAIEIVELFLNGKHVLGLKYIVTTLISTIPSCMLGWYLCQRFS